MLMARAASIKSKDPSTQVGAVVVDENHCVVGTGYNGPPRGTDDRRAFANREAKLLRVLHAEENALLMAKGAGHAIYCTHQPCAHCAAMIVQAGIREVYYPPMPADFKLRWMDSLLEGQAMFREAGVKRQVVEIPEILNEPFGSTEQLADVRDEFEAWANSRGWSCDKVASDSSAYRDGRVQMCWEAWKASAGGPIE